MSIIEESVTKDCIFLRNVDGVKQCRIYSVRPGQCRTWPFWPENLFSPDDWNRAALRCPGINRGRLYTLRRNRENPKEQAMVGEPAGHRRLVEEVAALYDWIEDAVAAGARPGRPVQGVRGVLRLPRLRPPALRHAAGADLPGREARRASRLEPMPAGRCPYQRDGKCTIHEHRFAGCRIFCCDRRSRISRASLSEAALKRLKGLCEEFQIPYRYHDLATALNTFTVEPGQ